METVADALYENGGGAVDCFREKFLSLLLVRRVRSKSMNPGG